MWGNSQRYYRPYSSDDESDSDQSDTGTSVSSDTSRGTGTTIDSSESIESTDSNLQNQIIGPNFKQFALNLQRSAGPSFSTIKDQLEYAVDRSSSKVPYSYYEAVQGAPDPALLSNYGSTKFTTESKQQTSIIMIDSTYRDYSVYQQPTLLTLRLPRVYKNIVNIQLVQIKLLSSFYYFSPTKNNISMTIQEIGRYITGTSNLQQFQIVIKQGTYDINSLLTELNNQINQTPLFYYYKNFFDDFNIKFQTNGNYSLNFNEAGDAYYDPITQTFIQNPTKAFIVSKFWKNPTGGQTEYSTIQAKVAYYYPPLKWAIINNNYSFLDFSKSLNVLLNVTTVSDIISYIYNGFIGLDDPLIASIITENILPNDPTNRLENYRTSNTFKHYPINRYVIALEPQSQKITISSTSLNTSLVTLINNQYSSALTNEILYYPTTVQYYITSQTQISQVNSLVQDMYSYLQKNFLSYFAVDYNQYSIDYYTHLDWLFFLQNGTNVIGLASNLLSYEEKKIVTNTSNIISKLQQNPTHYWPRYQNINGITTVNNTVSMTNLSNSQFGDLNHPYIMETGEFYMSNFSIKVQAIDTNGFLYSDITNSLNCIVPIEASKYTVFKFHSPVRQSIQVETLPRPLQYRIPDYNRVNYSNYVANAFDASYCFIPYSNMPYSNNSLIYPNYDTLFDNLENRYLIQVPGWSSSNVSPLNSNYSWGNSLLYTLDLWQSNNGSPPINISSYNRSQYFTFTTPLFSNDTPNDYTGCNFRYILNCMALIGNTANTSSNYEPAPIPQLFRCFLYRDRAAFQADVLYSRNESPINFLISTIIDSNVNSNIGFTNCSNLFSFETYPNQQYYMIIRPDEYSFGNVFISVNPFFEILPPHYDVLTSSISNINPSTDVFMSNFYKNNFQYSKLYDPAYLGLPIQSNLMGDNPDTATGITPPTIYETPLGYDINGVSTDYTDYIPYIPNSNANPNENLISFDPYKTITGIDPITQYIFQKNQPYNILCNTYIYRSSTSNPNTVLTPAYNRLYTPSNILKRQVKICHYYSLTYILDTTKLSRLNPLIYCNAAQQPYLETTTPSMLSGYTYTSVNNGTLNYLTLGRGIFGFSFVPDVGIWDIDNVIFRSAISDSNNDPNREIVYLGVYNMNDIYQVSSNNIQLNSAIAILTINTIRTYTPSNTRGTQLFMNGFDSKGGTYYEFKKVPTFVSSNTRQIIGSSQKEATLITDPNNMYSLLAFDSQSNLTYIEALSGSAIPYPLYNNIRTSNSYLDSNYPPNLKYDIVYPSGSNQTQYSFVGSNWNNYRPPSGYPTGTQAQFEQSTPIGTSVVHYDDFIAFSINSNAMYAWNNVIKPNNIILTVPNYALFQEINYNLYKFDSLTPSRTFSNLICTYTASEIENTYANQSIVAVSGNSFAFVFLGFSQDIPGTETTFQLRFTFLNSNGVLSVYDPPSPIYVPVGGTVQDFYFRDTNDFVLSYQQLDSQMSVYWSVNGFTNVYSNIFPNTSHSNMAMALDCRGGPIYWMPLNSNNTSGSNIYKVLNIDSKDSNAFIPTSLLTPTGGSIKFNMVNYDSSPLVTYFRKFITWWTPNQDTDILYFITNNPSYTSNIFILTNIDYDISTIYIRKCIFTPSNTNNQPLNILSIHSGSPVIQSINPFELSRSPSIFIITDGVPTIWGNLSTEIDDPRIFASAWQIFYPFQKIILTKLANGVSPIGNSNYINYPEYPHTQLFYYRNSNAMCNDINSSWGQESNSNFLVANTDFDGYYFNSYIFNVPAIVSSNDDYQYLVVRNYTPTEQSQVLMRFYLPGKYNFGYMSLNDLINELYLVNTSNTSKFDKQYQTVITAFDKQFNTTRIWGNNNTAAYSGSTMSFTCFSSFMTSYINLNNIYNNAVGLVDTITSNVNESITEFLKTELSNILPALNASRQNYTDAYQFNILWSSALLPQYKNLNTQWGLGWNLGFTKIDTPFTTFLRADSFYKILDDYIFMRLNPEYKLNTLDTTNNEDLAVSRDTTGQIENYHAKILLASFGNYSYTSIINPAILNPPLPRLDQMYFQLVDITGAQLNNMDCEWSATLQIVEQTTQATYGSLLPRLS